MSIDLRDEEVDTVPTSGSTNPIDSNAVFVGLAGKQDTLFSATNIKTVNGSSILGSGNLVVGGASNPSVIALSATDGTIVTGTTVDTLSRSLLIPANTFTSNGMLEVLCRMTKTGVFAGTTVRVYKNTSNTLTGATQIGLLGSPFSSTILWCQAIKTFRINSNTLTGQALNVASLNDYASSGTALLSTTFTTNVDNYIIFSIQLSSASDSANISMARATIYI